MADSLPLERFEIRISRVRESRPQHPFCIKLNGSRVARGVYTTISPVNRIAFTSRDRQQASRPHTYLLEICAVGSYLVQA
jgi:hypothetical protein